MSDSSQMLYTVIEVPFHPFSPLKSINVPTNIRVLSGLPQPQYAQSPSLILLDSNLTIVLESNDQGLLLASSRDGYIKLTKDEIFEKFAEGIDYLTIERTLDGKL